LRVTVSKRSLKEGTVELKLRSSAELQLVPLKEATARIAEIVRSWPR
jgi:hypothetical protein